MPLNVWLILFASALLLFIIWRLSPDAMEFLIRLGLRVVIGGAVIYAVDIFGRRFGILIGVNPVTSAVVGLLGVPGAALLFLWHSLYA